MRGQAGPGLAPGQEGASDKATATPSPRLLHEHVSELLGRGVREVHVVLALTAGTPQACRGGRRMRGHHSPAGTSQPRRDAVGGPSSAGLLTGDGLVSEQVSAFGRCSSRFSLTCIRNLWRDVGADSKPFEHRGLNKGVQPAGHRPLSGSLRRRILSAFTIHPVHP